MIEFALADPEAETYQFVFAAVADPGDYQLGRVAEQNLALDRELDRLRIAHGALRAEHDLALAANVQQHAQHAESHQRAVSSLQAEVASRETEVASLRAELHATSRFVQRVEGSVCWQLFQRVRGVLYAVLGGERSPVARTLQAVLRLGGRGLLRNDGAPRS